ncbi:putative F-box protein At4g22170 [Tasmannia lanceolata]|uniref:putative F-box protein At4g22170 n=1 Tax=Tasmannia lanceolata TaxID=3420 RepID=UPI004062F2BB
MNGGKLFCVSFNINGTFKDFLFLGFWMLSAKINFLSLLKVKEKSKRKVEHRWSKHPMDIMVLILDQLSLEDHIRCGAVCMWWRTITRENPHPSSQLPWVLLYEKVENREIRSFFSPYDSRVYNLKLPEACGFQCRGSSGQWMIMKDWIKGHFLLNPFSRTKIKLPCKVPLCRFEFKPRDIKKAMVFPPPTFSDHKTKENYVVVVLCRGGGLFSCRMGDERWTSVGKECCEYEDFIFYKGTFYAITVSGELVSSNFGGKRGRWDDVVSQLPAELMQLIKWKDHSLWPQPYSIYLIESCGELLVVLGYCFPPTYNIKTSHVFKLDWSFPKWVLMESISDSILFLRESCSMLRFRGNCSCLIHKNPLGGDLRMFYLEKYVIKRHIRSCRVPRELLFLFNIT